MANLIENRQIRVFISSTFRDMQNERDYLMKRTFPKLRKLAAERDVTLTELDLRWGITEEESKSGKVVEICLREIENSIPFFIGIIGNRYGWVPKRDDLDQNVTERFKDVKNYLERHLSVTEMEMQFGVLQRKEDTHAYFYIKEGEDSANADNPEMLERLKKEVKASRYPTSTYSSPENLAEQVEQAFVTLLDQLFPEGNISELEKERIGQRAFMNQLCLNYIRDERNFKALDDWLHDADTRQLVVTGASGLGKSALIANWIKEKITNKYNDYNIIYHFIGNGGSVCSYEHIVRILSKEIKDLYGWNTNDISEDNQLNELFLKVSKKKKKLIIVLDAVNQIVDSDYDAKRLKWLPSARGSIKILFSTLEEDETMRLFQARDYPIYRIASLRKDYRRKLVKQYLHSYGKSLSSFQTEKIVSDSKCKNTLVLKTLLNELVNFGSYEKLDDKIEYYLSPKSEEDFYQVLLKSYENDYHDYGNDFVKHILSLICFSYEGLREEEIIEISGIKRLHWSQFYCSFLSNLSIKKGQIYFSHNAIYQAVIHRYFENHKDWENHCGKEIATFLEKVDIHRSWEELPFCYYVIGDKLGLYHAVSSLNVIRYFVIEGKTKNLAMYWKTLIDDGYEFPSYFSQLEQDSLENKNYPILLLLLVQELFLYDLALKYCNGYEKKLLKCGSTESFADDWGILYTWKGHIFYHLSNYEEALINYEKALNIRKSYIGEVCMETSISYGNLAHYYMGIGEYNKAYDYFHKELEIGEQIFDAKDTRIAHLYLNISRALYYLDKYEQVAEYVSKAFLIFQIALDDYGMAIASNNMAFFYSENGDYEEAIKLYNCSLAAKYHIGMENGPEVAKTYGNIGMAYNGLGNYAKALGYLSIALEMFEQCEGSDKTDIVSTYKHIGDTYCNIKKYQKAINYYKKGLSIIESLNSDKQYLDTTFYYNEIAWMYHLLGKHDKALPWIEKAFEMLPNEPNYIDTLATIYQGLGRYDDALYQLARCLYLLFNDKEAPQKDIYKTEKKITAICKLVHGKENINTANSYESIGATYYNHNDYNKALEYYLMALTIREKELGKEHLDTAVSYNAIGLVYHDQGEFTHAMEYYQKALYIREHILGKEHPDTATSYNNIGTIYRKLGDYQNALVYRQKELEYHIRNLGEDSLKTASAYNNVGAQYRDLKEYDKAIEYVSKAYEIAEKIENTIAKATYLNRLGRVYALMGDKDMARIKFQEALALLPEDHPEAMDSRERLNDI